MGEKLYGLLGRKLGHSWSVPIHKALGCADYRLIELEPEQLGDFLRREDIGGLNVTIPYKRDVMQFCDVIDPAAETIGSVNTLVRRDGRLYGYNTDIDGFLHMLRRAKISLAGKKVLILGSGSAAQNYLRTIRTSKELGFHPIGHIASQRMKGQSLTYLGNFDNLEAMLEKYHPDEVVSAVELEDYCRTPQIISACEKSGTKLSIIPIYAEYMSAHPQFDNLKGIPLMNIRRIPLDNWANAFCKRAMDVAGSLLLILLTSPVMLVCAIGVRLSSPGPVIFKQKRVGLNKKTFYMYKFRSMRVNNEQDTHWTGDHDSRKTAFGAFLRKCSLDEFPQFFNVLKGDMSLVGPRPEIPYYVEQFREDIPLYMVKHQVRPGITGWAQVNDLRGDTSIEDRIQHDLYYIENWSLLFDLKILLITVFRGKFLNSEKLS